MNKTLMILYVKNSESGQILLNIGNTTTKLTIISNEVEALNLLKFSGYDIVIMDWQLSTLKGRELAEVIYNRRDETYNDFSLLVSHEGDFYEDVKTGRRIDKRIPIDSLVNMDA